MASVIWFTYFVKPNGCNFILNVKLYYQQQHLTYSCNLAR